MISGQPLETNQNKQLTTGHVVQDSRVNLTRSVLICLLAATAFIHWYLPIVHPIETAQAGGLIPISHNMLHLLFTVNGVGYFVLMASVAGWLPLGRSRQRRLYSVVAVYAALTIFAWIVLSDPAERGALDYVDKLIEIAIVALAIWMVNRLPAADSS
jgi:hypothetical protein